MIRPRLVIHRALLATLLALSAVSAQERPRGGEGAQPATPPAPAGNTAGGSLSPDFVGPPEPLVGPPKPSEGFEQPKVPSVAVARAVEEPSDVGDVGNPDAAVQPIVEAPVDPEKGITRVTVLDGSRALAVPIEDPGQASATHAKSGLPRLLSPYPPKALAPLPEGWKLTMDPAVKSVPYQVKLSDGRNLAIEVFPPSLVPEAMERMVTIQLGRGEDSPEAALAATRKAQAEARSKVQDLLKNLDAVIPRPPPPPADPETPTR